MSALPDTSATDGAAKSTLHVIAGDARIALALDVAGELSDIGSRIAVPGAEEWCLGLVSLRGHLLTLLDAGALFGHRPVRAKYQVLLRGLQVETALAVEGVDGFRGPDAVADLILDRNSLRAHPAFQPNAAYCRDQLRVIG